MLLNLQQHLFEKLNALVFKLLALLEHLLHVFHVLRGQFVQLLDGFLITFFSLKGKKGRNDESHLTNKNSRRFPHSAKGGGGRQNKMSSQLQASLLVSCHRKLYLLDLLLTLFHLFLEFLLGFRVIVALEFAVSLPAGCKLLFFTSSVVGLLQSLYLQV